MSRVRASVQAAPLFLLTLSALRYPRRRIAPRSTGQNARRRQQSFICLDRRIIHSTELLDCTGRRGSRNSRARWRSTGSGSIIGRWCSAAIENRGQFFWRSRLYCSSPRQRHTASAICMPQEWSVRPPPMPRRRILVRTVRARFARAALARRHAVLSHCRWARPTSFAF